MLKSKEPTKQMMCNIPASLHKKLRIFAAQNESTITEVVIGLIKHHIYDNFDDENTGGVI